MISNKDQSKIISSLGWVDHGSLWMFDLSFGKATSVQIRSAKYLSIQNGRNDYFSAVHHYDKDQVEISVHHFSNPAQTICKATINAKEKKYDGEIDV